VSHALLPAFVLARRLDAAEPVGAVIGQVAAGACGVRRAAAAAGVPHTTARGWVRRFTARAGELAVSFSALAVELGGEVARPLPDPLRSAVAAMGAAFTANCALDGGRSQGDAFRITAYSDDQQAVTQDGITTWEFDIQALKRGHQTSGNVCEPSDSCPGSIFGAQEYSCARGYD
jgi:hypothetical protein